jgi:hypothetical protein
LVLVASATLVACTEAKRDDSGAIVEAGDVRADALRVGDCFQDWEGALSSDLVEVSDFSAVPCSRPHDNEVFHVFDVSGDDFPGDPQLEGVADRRCLDRFEGYVDRDYASSRLAYGWVIPTESSWKQGDREIVCFLFDGELGELTGSMRGSGE